MAREDKYSQEEKNIEFSWDLTNLWESFEKGIKGEIQNLGKEISLIKKEFSGVAELLNLKAIEIKDALNVFSESNEIVSKEKQELELAVSALKELKGKTVSINTADVNFIIDSMAKIVSADTDKVIKENLEGEDLSRKFKRVVNLSKKIEDQLGSTNNGLKELLLYCQKGTDSIYTSEVIVLKLMSTLQFLDRLSEKNRNKIINSDLSVFQNVSELLESRIQDETTASSNTIQTKETFPEKRITNIESSIHNLDDKISNLEKLFITQTKSILKAINQEAKPIKTKKETAKSIVEGFFSQKKER